MAREREEDRLEEEDNENTEERSESKDLKEREYKDKQGNVHHHTKKYAEQHGRE